LLCFSNYFLVVVLELLLEEGITEIGLIDRSNWRSLELGDEVQRPMLFRDDILGKNSLCTYKS
jgi:hypothetical protein